MSRLAAFRLIGVASGLAALLLLPGAALAHGVAPVPATWVDVALAWSLEAHVLLPLLGLGLAYRWAAVVVSRRHVGNPWPRWRAWAWYLGLVVLLVAFASPIGTYDTTLFSVHMVQHLLLALIAAPLLALGAPITLLLRVSSPAARRRWLLPVLHSRVLRVVSFPVVTWIVFAAVMWAAHFSALFDAALDNEAAHVLEHGLFLGAALLFWWPVVGADPSPWRLPHPARLAYLFLGMPQSSFLGLAIFSAPDVLYPHYANLVRPLGPTPLYDQQLAGGIMWAGGDLMFLVGMIVALWVWLRAEEREGRLADARLDRELARSSAAPAVSAGQTPRVDRPA
ncbi:MAG: cytochrome c oxidase assembly protein [Chloroflexota bacterium]